MPVHLKALVVILALASAVFVLAVVPVPMLNEEAVLPVPTDGDVLNPLVIVGAVPESAVALTS